HLSAFAFSHSLLSHIATSTSTFTPSLLLLVVQTTSPHYHKQQTMKVTIALLAALAAVATVQAAPVASPNLVGHVHAGAHNDLDANASVVSDPMQPSVLGHVDVDAKDKTKVDVTVHDPSGNVVVPGPPPPGALRKRGTVVGDLIGNVDSHTTNNLDAHVTAEPTKPYPNSVVSQLTGDVNADAHDQTHTVTDITPVAPGAPGFLGKRNVLTPPKTTVATPLTGMGGAGGPLGPAGGLLKPVMTVVKTLGAGAGGAGGLPIPGLAGGNALGPLDAVGGIVPGMASVSAAKPTDKSKTAATAKPKANSEVADEQTA
ncbi:hypothetical protein GQ42DRAFT_170582, partial [Ramicandelaber brevisporus]